MPSKGNKVVSTKLTENSFERLETYANAHQISVSALLKLFVNSVLGGEIEVEKGDLKLGVDPIGYAVSADDELELERYKDLKLDKLARAFEEYCYPDYLVRQQIECLISQIKDNGKYKPRRSNDGGC